MRLNSSSDIRDIISSVLFQIDGLIVTVTDKLDSHTSRICPILHSI